MPNDLTTILMIDDTHHKLMQLEAAIKLYNLRPEAILRINWCGSEFALTVSAVEPYNKKGYWRREFSREGNISEISSTFNEAADWAANLPSPEQRAISMSLQWLNEAIDKLPTDSANQAQVEIMENIGRLLREEAERLASNILPHPTDVKAVATTNDDSDDDDDIPF